MHQFTTQTRDRVNKFSIKLDQKLVNFYFCDIYKNCSHLEKMDNGLYLALFCLINLNYLYKDYFAHFSKSF